jgi:Ca2+-binding RTX toxin-like protein
MSENERQEGFFPDPSVAAPKELALQTPSAMGEILLAEALLDNQQDGDLPPLTGGSALEDLATILGEAPPLEAEAGAQGPKSSGSSTYSSDFGERLAGLQPAAGATDGVIIPGSLAALPGAANAAVLLDGALPAAASGDGDISDGSGTVGGGDTGSGGDDALFTQQGNTVDFNDVAIGDYLDGSQYDALGGNDLVTLPGDAAEAAQAGFTAGTQFQAGNGNDTVTGGSLADLVDGGNGRDELSGGSGSDTLSGGNGGDSLFGGADDDLLSGGGDNGRDRLDGGSGADTLFGGNGNDTLIGGTGDDVMTGGGGRDTFVFSLASDSGDDVILDFTDGKGGDILQISDLTDLNGDSVIDSGDLDAGGHSVTGTADSVVITFDTGAILTLDGLDGTGVNSFADLLDMKVNIDIV